ncbi:MAG: hypothetical protein E5299_00161 [Burkholderia gladioli]|nr:MAG: hypothetical protein E5299_00161 [Burkholderia gladioli]
MGLINGGNVTIWIDEVVLARMPETPSPVVVTAISLAMPLIQASLGVKTLYRRTLRALKNFARSLRYLVFPNFPMPNYTTLFSGQKCLILSCRFFA